MHSVLARMRLERPLESYKVRKEGKLLEFTIVDGDSSQKALEFLGDERQRLKTIEKTPKVEKKAQSRSETSPQQSPELHTRSRSQKSLFEFEETSSDPWSPVLDGSDPNHQ